MLLHVLDQTLTIDEDLFCKVNARRTNTLYGVLLFYV